MHLRSLILVVVVSLSGPGGSTLRTFDCLTGQLTLERRLHAPHADHLDPHNFGFGVEIAFIPETVDIVTLTNGRAVQRIGADGTDHWVWESPDKS